MEMSALFSSESARALMNDTLRMFVGRDRRMSWTDLETVTGDGERKLRSYVEPDGPMMPFDVFLRVFATLPPEAFARIARHMGFTASPLDSDQTATMRRVLTQSARLVADGTQALEDGRIDHREMAMLRRQAEDMLPMLSAIAMPPEELGR